jgi:hypothetical protein
MHRMRDTSAQRELTAGTSCPHRLTMRMAQLGLGDDSRPRSVPEQPDETTTSHHTTPHQPP